MAVFDIVIQLPMQYSNASAGEVAIALIMSPSNYSSGDKEYLGPILFNPGMCLRASRFPNDHSMNFLGGPGDSGVQYVLGSASSFRQIIGPQYDLVGFDPRGKHDIWRTWRPSLTP